MWARAQPEPPAARARWRSGQGRAAVNFTLPGAPSGAPPHLIGRSEHAPGPSSRRGTRDEFARAAALHPAVRHPPATCPFRPQPIWGEVCRGQGTGRRGIIKGPSPAPDTGASPNRARSTRHRKLPGSSPPCGFWLSPSHRPTWPREPRVARSNGVVRPRRQPPLAPPSGRQASARFPPLSGPVFSALTSSSRSRNHLLLQCVQQLAVAL